MYLQLEMPNHNHGRVPHEKSAIDVGEDEETKNQPSNDTPESFHLNPQLLDTPTLNDPNFVWSPLFDNNTADYTTQGLSLNQDIIQYSRLLSPIGDFSSQPPYLVPGNQGISAETPAIPRDNSSKSLVGFDDLENQLINPSQFKDGESPPDIQDDISRFCSSGRSDRKSSSKEKISLEQPTGRYHRDHQFLYCHPGNYGGDPATPSTSSASTRKISKSVNDGSSAEGYLEIGSIDQTDGGEYLQGKLHSSSYTKHRRTKEQMIADGDKPAKSLKEKKKKKKKKK
ncbi:hypothetical protein DASC09_020140 [Saccharomycopsis crataegensis]|uniref:Uncharacterized protein n=1 Tax=Saccharomycopsis crataegensis TaxID=43959 RepID=A0AAV5QIX0_9ASCO|nr:hypothetical protein DASC09_020140 [Saccharomycopsis crataegensis]